MDPSTREAMLIFLKAAHRIAGNNLAPFRGKYSKKRFTQPQITACLLLGGYLCLDSRDLEKIFRSDSSFQRAVKLRTVPDHATFCRWRIRLGHPSLVQCMEQTVDCLPQKIRRTLSARSSVEAAHRRAAYYLFKTPHRAWKVREISSAKIPEPYRYTRFLFPARIPFVCLSRDCDRIAKSPVPA